MFNVLYFFFLSHILLWQLSFGPGNDQVKSRSLSSNIGATLGLIREKAPGSPGESTWKQNGCWFSASPLLSVVGTVSSGSHGGTQHLSSQGTLWVLCRSVFIQCSLVHGIVQCMFFCDRLLSLRGVEVLVTSEICSYSAVVLWTSLCIHSLSYPVPSEPLIGVKYPAL